MRDPIVDAVADVLSEPDVDAARDRLAAALLAATGAELAARVSVGALGDVALHLHGRFAHPDPASLPSAADIRRHPLFRYRAETGAGGTTTLLEVVRGGWPVDETTLGIFDALALSMHQAELAMTIGHAYSGWTLIAPTRISPLQLRPLIEHERLLRGLDRHIELLARVDAQPTPAADARPCPLTPRELVVLRLMAASRTAAAIGAQLGVSPRTVHKHQEHLYRKLGARDRLEAVLVGQRTGLPPPLPGGEETRFATTLGDQPTTQLSRPVMMPIDSASKSASER
jgi:DNA-binding CsgD family transcriptional regulator